MVQILSLPKKSPECINRLDYQTYRYQYGGCPFSLFSVRVKKPATLPAG